MVSSDEKKRSQLYDLQTLLLSGCSEDSEFYKQVTHVGEIDSLSDQELKHIMRIPSSTGASAAAEMLLRRVFTVGVIYGYPDVHIRERGDPGAPEIVINIKAGTRFLNFVYRGTAGKRFREKILELCGIPQGGSTPAIVSTRFSMTFPADFVVRHGLKLKENPFYVVDVRVECSKILGGYSLVCRLLDQQKAPTLDEIEMTYAVRRLIKSISGLPSGMLIVSGPTGSGKSALLNAIVRHLNNGDIAIHTIEDPPEYTIFGDGPIKQIAVSHEIPFARALRSALRSAPRLILLGEIRDKETMSVALEAAATGHLVITTIHANSASETITRALELTPDRALDAYRLADVLKLVIAQRLLVAFDGDRLSRKITPVEADWLTVNGMDGMLSFVTEPQGNESRPIPALECIEVSAEVKESIRSGADTAKIYEAASLQLAFEPLAVTGVRSLENGRTRLFECMTKLETNTYAQRSPCQRILLARKFNLTLARLSEGIDNYLATLDQGRQCDIEEFLAC